MTIWKDKNSKGSEILESNNSFVEENKHQQNNEEEETTVISIEGNAVGLGFLHLALSYINYLKVILKKHH